MPADILVVAGFTCDQFRPGSHRPDESASGDSSAGCTPAGLASASPLNYIFSQAAATANRHRQRGGEFAVQQNAGFSIGIDILALPAALKVAICQKRRQSLAVPNNF
jgi:hypothetical protein